MKALEIVKVSNGREGISKKFWRRFTSEKDGIGNFLNICGDSVKQHLLRKKKYLHYKKLKDQVLSPRSDALLRTKLWARHGSNLHLLSTGGMLCAIPPPPLFDKTGMCCSVISRSHVQQLSLRDVGKTSSECGRLAFLTVSFLLGPFMLTHIRNLFVPLIAPFRVPPPCPSSVLYSPYVLSPTGCFFLVPTSWSLSGSPSRSPCRRFPLVVLPCWWYVVGDTASESGRALRDIGDTSSESRGSHTCAVVVVLAGRARASPCCNSMDGKFGSRRLR